MKKQTSATWWQSQQALTPNETPKPAPGLPGASTGFPHPIPPSPGEAEVHLDARTLAALQAADPVIHHADRFADGHQLSLHAKILMELERRTPSPTPPAPTSKSNRFVSGGVSATTSLALASDSDFSPTGELQQRTPST